MIDRRILLAGLAAAPMAGCLRIPLLMGPRATGPDLKVVTFNIWHNQGDWAARLPLLVAAIRAADPDVIGLQEVLEDAAVGLPNQAQTLAEALGGYSVHFVSTDPDGAPRRYGNAILSRLPVTEVDSRKLQPLDDYRTALRVRVALGGRSVDVVNTHLAWQEDAAAVRARQIADLVSMLPQDGTPLVVMGDFNAVQEDAGLAALTGPRFFSALPRETAVTTLNPARGHPPRVIDHIFAETAHFWPVSASVIGSQPVNGEYPSDHFGLAATITVL